MPKSTAKEELELEGSYVVIGSVCWRVADPVITRSDERREDVLCVRSWETSVGGEGNARLVERPCESL